MDVQLERLHESLRYENPLVPMRVFRHQKEKDIWNSWHYHVKQIELLYILEGKLDVYIENELYPLAPGDVVLIGTNQLHRDFSYGVKYFVFQFDCQHYIEPANSPYMKLFMGMNFPLSKLNYIFTENKQANQTVTTLISTIYTEAKNKEPGYEMALGSLIRQVLLTILRNDNRNLFTAKNHLEMMRLRPVFDFIEHNLTRKIEVAEASKLANMSYYHFVKTFKKAVGMTFVDYLNYHKIKLAERILLTKDVSVEQTAHMIGMDNLGHFYHLFKRYNQCPPGEFRRKMMDWGK